jgi:hypothetical protein
MTNAELEADPERKMKGFLLAEKCLQRSAELYETAGYVGRRDEVLRTLIKVKEKSEFSLSLGEFLAAPSDASATRMMPTPSMSIEEPVGLQKFDSAFLQASLVADQREVHTNENIHLDVHLANLGKNAAFLVRVEGIIPAGFDVVERPEKCMIENECIIFKGRKLAPLETAEMKLTLKPRKKGMFSFVPKVQYMEETGEYKSFELERLTVTIKELGIRGWLKGPD